MAEFAGQFTSVLLQDTTPWEGLNLQYIYSGSSVLMCERRGGPVQLWRAVGLNTAASKVAEFASL